MSWMVTIPLDVPDDLTRLQLPAGVNARLQKLLDHQDRGRPLNAAERSEAEGLVELAELLTLLRLRAEGAVELVSRECDDDRQWEQRAAEEFGRGYADANAIHDPL
jgi:hypothetical protein